MKVAVFIFSSGKGTRLRPYTERIPKPLLPLDNEGSCLLSRTINRLLEYDITDIFINYSYGKKRFLGLQSRYKDKATITLVEDRDILGQGGILLKSKELYRTFDVILCLNGDTYIDLDYGNLIKSTDITAAHFLSDLVVEKAKPYLLVDKKDNIIGYQSPTRGDLYFYPGIEATKPARKLNYLGVISIPTKLLSGIPYDGSFLGFFGRDDLMERLYLKSCVTVPFTDVAVNEFISIDTCEEYERILKENGYTRPILRPQA